MLKNILKIQTPGCETLSRFICVLSVRRPSRRQRWRLPKSGTPDKAQDVCWRPQFEHSDCLCWRESKSIHNVNTTVSLPLVQPSQPISELHSALLQQPWLVFVNNEPGTFAILVSSYCNWVLRFGHCSKQLKGGKWVLFAYEVPNTYYYPRPASDILRPSLQTPPDMVFFKPFISWARLITATISVFYILECGCREHPTFLLDTARNLV